MGVRKQNRWKVGERKYDLSVAVKLIDIVTGGRPNGEPDVRIETADSGIVDATTIKTRSDYYLFFGIPENVDTIWIIVEAGDEYHTVSEKKDIAALRSATPREYEVEIQLAPTTAYRFPANRTTIRGHVWDETSGAIDPVDRVPVSDAEVTVADVDPGGTIPRRDLSMKTTPLGEFVLYFEPFTEEYLSGEVNGVRLVPDSGERILKINGNDPTIEVTHPHYQEGSLISRIEENTTVVREVEISPS